MAKYSPNVELIRGAAIAEKNWENVPGMYAGLDKVTAAGEKLMEKSFEKIDQETKENNIIRKKFNNDAKDVYGKAGGLGDNDYKSAIDEVTALEQEYFDALKSGDTQLIADVDSKFRGMLEKIQSQKEFREVISDPINGLSNSVKGDNLKIITAWNSGDYKKSKDLGTGEYNFTMNIDGIGEVTKTQAEIAEIANLKNPNSNIAFSKLYNKSVQRVKRHTKQQLRFDIGQIIPEDSDELNAFLNDDGFGMEPKANFKTLLYENRPNVEQEIMTLFDTNKDSPGIDDKEYANFVDAITNPDNEFWKDNPDIDWQEMSSNIATDALTNIVNNGYEERNGVQEEKGNTQKDSTGSKYNK